MMRVQVWDPRTEGPTPPIVADEAFIKSKLDGTFMEWIPNEAIFRCKKVPRKFIKAYGPHSYHNQFDQQRAPVDQAILQRLAEIVCRYMDDPISVLSMKNHGSGLRYTRSQKLFVLAGADFVGASLIDLGVICKRDKIGMHALHRAATEMRQHLKDDLNEISARFMA